MTRRNFLQYCSFTGGTVLISMIACDNSHSSTLSGGRSRITAAPLRDVRIEDGFWSPKLALWRQTTINDCWDKFEKSGALENFDRVAAGKKDGYKGEPWWDGLVYEMITACADFLATTPDPALERRINGYIERISAAAAVDPAGYVNTAVTLRQVAPRWSNPPTPGDKHDDRFPHTLYNAGCLVEAAVHYQRATGQTRLLQVATRLANYMCSLMGPSPLQNIVPGHALPEIAFLELSQLYRENQSLRSPMGALGDGSDYAKLAQFWIDNRGKHEGRANTEAYNQDDRPVQEQTTLEGHAVRALLLAAGLARASVVADRADYQPIAARWWQNMADARQYITGGLGAVAASEGFGADYDLPNNGYCETCAAVAGGQFGQEMFLATGQMKYIETLEKVLYNGALSGVSLAGTSYYYTNFLETGPGARRWDWHTCPCCPPMFLKLMGALPSHIYATNEDSVFVNLYIGSEAKLKVGGKGVRLEQKSEAPWEGNSTITVHPEEAGRFVLRLRVPGWAERAEVKVNDQPVPATPGADGYLPLDRSWKSGDRVTITSPMPIRRIHADSRVVADKGRVALMRGPIVYCFEGIDCGTPVRSLVLPPNAPIKAEERPDFLGGMTVLTGEAQIFQESADAPRAVKTAFTAIPYYANTNREPTTMMVWVAEEIAVASPSTLADHATPTASHINPSDTLATLNDAVLPKKSDDDTIPRFTWWDHKGTAEWVQYEFKTPHRVNAIAVYWWDERRVGRHCRVPQDWHVEYRDGDTWKPVAHPSGYGKEMDTFNKVTFDPVETVALRLVVQLQHDWSAGILEWRVFGEDRK